MKRRREKAGFTTLLIAGDPVAMPNAVAGRWVRMEMALKRISEISEAEIQTSPRSAVQLAITIAGEAVTDHWLGRRE